MKLFLTALVWLACLALPAQAQSPLAVSVTEASGLPLLSAGGAPALRTELLFWGPQWKWAGTEANSQPQGAGRYQAQGQVKDLGLQWAAEVNGSKPGTLRTDWRWQAQTPRDGVIGGGLVFKFDLGLLAASMGTPTLLPGNAGWQWGKPGGPQFTLRFEPAVAKVYLERNNPAEVRAFFYEGAIPAGDRRHTMTLSWAGGDVAFAPTTAERLGGPPVAQWPQDVVDVRTSPVDLSRLNAADKPAGKRGPVRVQGDALVWADGSPARFWGTNVTAYALFATPPDVICQQAKRLAALGHNLVRLHHHDSPWVEPNIFGSGKTRTSSQALHPDSLARLDRWIKCLKDEGIYVWLDMHVQRAFRAGDNIWAFDEMAKGKPEADLKGYSHINLTVQQAMKRFNEAYLNRVNPLTGLNLLADPAVLAVQITNENDITHHFGNSLLPDKNVPQHNRLYMAEAEGFAKTHKLPRDKVWRSWEHGPSKLFLNDLEFRFGADMRDHLRRLGLKAPISTTSTWGNNPISSLPALTAGDVVDVHSYGGPGQLEANPLSAANALHWMAAAQVPGMPLTVTEWNAEPFPLPDRHALPLYVAATAAHQGWDALMHYAYTQQPVAGPGGPSNWHAYNDPALLAMMPAAALLYRERHAREATSTYVFDPGPEVFFGQAISPANAPALRTAMERGKLLVAMPATPQLPWLKRAEPPAGATVLRDPAQSVLPRDAVQATTDTGELTRHWAKGTYTINTPLTRAAMGWIGGDTVELPGVQIKLATRHASVAVQSLDGKPVGESADLLVSLGTRAQPQPGNRMPMVVEPLEGDIRIKAPPGLKAWRNGPFNQRVELPAAYSNGHYTLKLDGKRSVQWVFVGR